MPFVIALGRAIRTLRQEKGLSQESLGRSVGIHPTWVSHIESGRVNPTIGNLVLISKGLGMGVSEVMSVAEELER